MCQCVRESVRQERQPTGGGSVHYAYYICITTAKYLCLDFKGLSSKNGQLIGRLEYESTFAEQESCIIMIPEKFKKKGATCV